MRTAKMICSVAGLVLLILLTGCDSGYEVWQADNWSANDYKPREIKKAAVVMYISTEINRNKTFLEGLTIALQQRGIRIVEHEVARVAQEETRLLLSKKSDVISTRMISERLGKQLALDAIVYADATGRDTYFAFAPKTFYADAEEAARRQYDANQRKTITPDDARRCKIVAHHNVGLSLHVVDVATGKIVMTGYRHLAVSQEYSSDHPEAVSNFGAVQTLAGAVAADILGR